MSLKVFFSVLGGACHMGHTLKHMHGSQRQQKDAQARLLFEGGRARHEGTLRQGTVRHGWPSVTPLPSRHVWESGNSQIEPHASASAFSKPSHT